MAAHILTLFLIAPFLLPHLMKYIATSLAPHCFIFQPATLQAISQQVITKHAAIANGAGDSGAVASFMQDLVGDLQSQYGPELINSYDPEKWLFNIAGGATGQMQILHASLTEYLILFGSATGTEGHSGAHMADDYFTILTGTQTASFLGELKPRVYNAGDQHHHPLGVPAQYKIANGTWALELAQGFIPAMLPFGLIQMPLSLEWDSLARTITITGRAVVANLLRGKI